MSSRLRETLVTILALVLTYLTTSCQFVFTGCWLLLTSGLYPYVHQAGNDFLYAMWMRYLAFYAEILSGTKLFLHGDVENFLKKKERVICISNHQSAVDWIVTSMLAERQGSLPHVRYLLKDSVQWMPLYGYLIYQRKSIYVNRSSFNANKLLSTIRSLQDNNIPSWIAIYPEGTRYSPDFKEAIEKSKKCAVDKGLKPFDHVYFPKYRGFHMVHSGLRNYLDAVYDFTIVYQKSRGERPGERRPAPTFADLVTSRCGEIHVHIKRIPIHEVPASEECVKRWIYDCFQEKEKMLESYYKSPLPLPAEHPLSKGTVSPPRKWAIFAAVIVYLSVSLPLLSSWHMFSIYLRAILYCSALSYVWKLAEYVVRCRMKYVKTG